jgi:parallel beta-helix repeat protein
MITHQKILYIILITPLATGGTLLLMMVLDGLGPARAAPTTEGFSDPRCNSVLAPGDVITVCLGGGCDYDTIQAAVDAASGGEIIKVAIGVYTGTGNEVVNVNETVTIRGGYSTNNFSDPPDPEANPTVIDGEGQRGGIFVWGDSVTATLESLQVTNGTTSGRGGGIQAREGGVIISACQVFSNTAAIEGGGIHVYNTSGSVQLLNNQIFDNVASDGGGMWIEGANNATVINNEIYANVLTDTWGTGGGIEIRQCDAVTLTDNRVYSNVALYFGGGIYFTDSPTSTLINNEVFSNSAGAYGGGIYVNYSNDITLTGNRVYSNTTTGRGGGIHITNECHNATLQNNLIYNNTATGTQEGGGIWLDDSRDVSLRNNYVHHNSADDGGAIFLSACDNATLINTVAVENEIVASGNGAAINILNSDAYLLHTTLVHNHGGNGQGIYLSNNSTVWLTNTILVSHTVGVEAATGAAISLEATLWGTDTWGNATDAVGSAIFTGTVNVYEAPGFVAPENNNHDLDAGSPAIDAGVYAVVATDIDNEPRIGPPDLGAYEGSFGVCLPLVLRNHQ